MTANLPHSEFQRIPANPSEFTANLQRIYSEFQRSELQRISANFSEFAANIQDWRDWQLLGLAEGLAGKEGTAAEPM